MFPVLRCELKARDDLLENRELLLRLILNSHLVVRVVSLEDEQLLSEFLLIGLVSRRVDLIPFNHTTDPMWGH